MPMHVSITVCSLGCLVMALGCSKTTPPPIAPSQGQEASQERVTPETPDSSGTIAIAEEIRKACGIGEVDAHFAYNSARIDKRASGVLDQVAKCFDSGPLAGRHMNLVGRADPRGDSEYNLVLGGLRASAVSTVLSSRGLAQHQMSSSSRGEMDATGTDATSWAEDRRVDVLLVSR